MMIATALRSVVEVSVWFETHRRRGRDGSEVVCMTGEREALWPLRHVVTTTVSQVPVIPKGRRRPYAVVKQPLFAGGCDQRASPLMTSIVSVGCHRNVTMHGRVTRYYN